jgi:hypothetical protein
MNPAGRVRCNIMPIAKGDENNDTDNRRKEYGREENR